VALAALLWALPLEAQPEPTPADFSGSWQSTYGVIEIEQVEARVTGRYTYASGSTLEGTVTGDRLTFRYREPDATGEGWFEISSDGQAFTGSWREDGTSVWYPWAGRRIRPPDEAGEPSEQGGLFETTYGRMRLVEQADGRVTGTYTFSGGSFIEGQMEGRRLTFRYREPTATGEGWFEFSEDGRSFRGAWREDGGTNWSEWTGERVEPEQGVTWLVVLEAHWETSLAEEEYAFGDMLRAYFERYTNVRVRHRRYFNRDDFLRSAAELAYLAEPVALLVAGHGTEGRLLANDGFIEPAALGRVLAEAPSVYLVHFSSCEMMVPGVSEAIHGAIEGQRRLMVSGYSVAVDWSASALLEFLYLDLVLGRGLAPSRAAELVVRELGFADETATEGSPLGAAHFRYVER
jgi:hypothetical protein